MVTATTWTAIYSDVDGPPVRQQPSQIAVAANGAAATGDRVEYIAAEFRKLCSVDQSQLQGRTANALVTTIEEVNKSLADVAPVFRSLEALLRAHQEQLDALRLDAGRALARARTAWLARRSAEETEQAAAREHTATSGQLASVRQRLAGWRQQLDSTSPEDAAYFVIRDQVRATEDQQARVAHDEQRAAARHERAQRQRADAEQELAYWRRGSDNSSSWESLREQEDALNRKTAERVNAIELRGLEDPGRLEKILSDVQGWINEGIEDAKAALDAIRRGAWGEALHRLSDVVARVAKAALVVVVVAIVAVVAVKLAPLLLATAAKAGAVMKGSAAIPTLAGKAGAAKTGLLSLGKNAAIASKFALKGGKLTKLKTMRQGLELGQTGNNFIRLTHDDPAMRQEAAEELIFGRWRKVLPMTDVIAEKLVPAPTSSPDGRARAAEELLRAQQGLVRSGAPSELGSLQPRLCSAAGGGR